jgi:pyruvate dehydrogenase E2 component (dihydrolipoamide acetyltransferase)
MSIEITMPRLSDTMESGTILKWNVSKGDAVSSGDVVADVETDKATMELTVYDDGTVASILVGEGQTVDIGTPIAVMAEDGEELDAVASGATGAGAGAAQAAGESAGSSTAVASPPAPPPVESAPPPSRDGAGAGRTRVSPVARRLAEENDIELHTLSGSGPGGRIIKRDVLRAIEVGEETAASVPPAATAPPASGMDTEIELETPAETATAAVPVVPVIPVAPVAPGAELAAPGLADRRIPLSNMRQTIAKRLVESKTTIPHYQVSMAIDMDPLLDMRKTLNEQLSTMGVKLSVNDFLVRCCALAMHRHPEVNSSWGGDHVLVHGAVHIGMAIALPSDRGGGLVVAVIRHADQKSLRAISAEAKHLAEKARTRGLTVEEMADSTFTLSNLGMFGVDDFTAIINPPNAAIMAVGGAIEKPVARNGELTVGREMSVTMSSDHRIIDGAMAAAYLTTVKEFIEQPGALLV